MPSQYSKESIPNPANDRVKIKTVEAATLAVFSFKCGTVQGKNLR